MPDREAELERTRVFQLFTRKLGAGGTNFERAAQPGTPAIGVTLAGRRRSPASPRIEVALARGQGSEHPQPSAIAAEARATSGRATAAGERLAVRSGLRRQGARRTLQNPHSPASHAIQSHVAESRRRIYVLSTGFYKRR
jgi:hypothetical protein